MANDVKLLLVDDNPMVLGMLAACARSVCARSVGERFRRRFAESRRRSSGACGLRLSHAGDGWTAIGGEVEEPSGDGEFFRDVDGQPRRTLMSASLRRMLPMIIWQNLFF